MKGLKLTTAAFALAAITASVVAPSLAQDAADSGDAASKGTKRQILVFPNQGGSIGPGGVELELVKTGEENGVDKFSVVQKTPTGGQNILNESGSALVLPPINPKPPAEQQQGGQQQALPNVNLPQMPVTTNQQTTPDEPAKSPQETNNGEKNAADEKNPAEEKGSGSSSGKAATPDDGKSSSQSGTNNDSKSASRSGTSSTPSKSSDSKSSSSSSKSGDAKKDPSGAEHTTVSWIFSKTLLTACIALSAATLLM